MASFGHRSLVGALIPALALLAAGCGASSNAASVSPHHSSGSGGATTTAPLTQSTASATTTTSTAAPTSTSTSSSGGAAVSTAACTAADLTPAFLNSNGATGHVVISFVLHNSSTGSCHTYGYPGVEFLSKTGAAITTDATRTTQDFAGRVPETGFTMNPGQEATFRMVTSDVVSNQNACVTAYGLQIIAPDDTATMKAAIPDGVSVCDGKATVSPLAAGTGASST